MSEPIVIPKTLAAAIERVTKQRYDSGKAEFKRQRTSVVRRLRELGFLDPDIARMLGVAPQYVAREYPRKVKP